MIKIEHIYTGNWEAAIRSMRNPLDSWNKSDSGFGCNGMKCQETVSCEDCEFNSTWCGNTTIFILGPNDLKLAKTLANAGTDHRKFMRSIIFSCDITAPMYWWKEMDTYKVGAVRNSCSTMHTITKKEFEKSDFSFEHVKEDVDKCDYILGRLNYARKMYLKTKDKDYWYSIIQLLPSSYNQKATWTANYEVLRNIYHARKNHKLDEWHDFCHMIEDLPYSELITGEE